MKAFSERNKVTIVVLRFISYFIVALSDIAVFTTILNRGSSHVL